MDQPKENFSCDDPNNSDVSSHGQKDQRNQHQEQSSLIHQTSVCAETNNDSTQTPNEASSDVIKYYLQELQNTRSALKHQEEELKSVKERLHVIEAFYKLKPDEAESALRNQGEQMKSDSKSTTKMEEFYKKQLEEAKSAQERAESALKQKEHELKSFKDRVAEEVALSIRTGNTESMNSPVSKTRLKEMYQELRVLKWPKIKKQLKNSFGPDYVRQLIQKMFKDAAEQMEKKKKQIDEVFGLKELSREPPSQKIQEYRLATIQNLQLTLYHRGKEDVLKTYFAEPEYKCLPDEGLRLLASECLWLGYLMALNKPPLQPHWENYDPRTNYWDVFPHDTGHFSPV